MKKTNANNSKYQGRPEGLPHVGSVYFFESCAGMRLVKIVAHLTSGQRTDIVFTYEENGYKDWDHTTDESKFHSLRAQGSEDLTRWAADVYGVSPKLN
jgi:hypothetical protein